VRSLAALLAGYGAYHRDPRNRLTHCFGVPAIIYAALIPAALQPLRLFGFATGLDRILVVALVAFYLVLDPALGLLLALLLAALAWAAETTTGLGVPAALTLAGVIFVLGWVLQLFGHHLEGNRPALLTNIFQILVAPIYLGAELLFALGLRVRLRTEVERQLAQTRQG
jgi:uncharacterized membrane protein YGL010W